jgi:hypothetical protein
MFESPTAFRLGKCSKKGSGGKNCSIKQAHLSVLGYAVRPKKQYRNSNKAEDDVV